MGDKLSESQCEKHREWLLTYTQLLISDAVRLMFAKKHPCYLTQSQLDFKQRKLWRFIFEEVCVSARARACVCH